MKTNKIQKNYLRKVSNEEFEYCLKDPNINGIVNSAAKSYRKQIDSDELEQLQYIATFTALSAFDGRKGCSFLSYLFNKVRWTCLDFLRSNLRKEKLVALETLPERYTARFSEAPLQLRDGVEPLIMDRFYGNYTLEELAEKYGTSRETIRNRLKGAICRLKNTL